MLLGIVILLITIAGPIGLALAGVFFRRRATQSQSDLSPARVTPAWVLMVNSAVIYALSFNVVFFIQELCLVVPKAMTPGLQPTLFHNNHTWSGDNPLAALFQGTGALAILITGLICLALLPVLRQRSPVVRLLVIWLAYHGLIMGLAQIPIGAFLPQSDVGMAMDYLGWSNTAKSAFALLALISIVVVALWLTRFVLELAAAPGAVSTATRRNQFVLKVATSAGLLGTLLIIPFRVPREMAEVFGPPIIVAIAGISWMQAGAWIRRSGLAFSGPIRTIAWPMVILLLVVFALFHLVLARGIRFF